MVSGFGSVPERERPSFRGQGTRADLAFVTQAGHTRSGNRGEIPIGETAENCSRHLILTPR